MWKKMHTAYKIGFAFLLLVVVVAVSLSFSAIKRQRVEREKERKAKVEYALALQKNPQLGVVWKLVNELPSGSTGYFRTTLKAGVATGIIKPPPSTWVEFSIPAPGGKVEFFDWYGKYVGFENRGGPEDTRCFSHPPAAVRITLKEDGEVKMQIGGQRSPRFAHCS